jgi:hypothetical protein
MMVTITDGMWIADLGNMTCRNIENGIVVVFEKNGGLLEGKIGDMPMELMEQWAGKPNGSRHIQNAVAEAEEVFLRAYFERKIEKGEGLGIDTPED